MEHVVFDFGQHYFPEADLLGVSVLQKYAAKEVA